MIEQAKEELIRERGLFYELEKINNANRRRGKQNCVKKGVCCTYV